MCVCVCVCVRVCVHYFHCKEWSGPVFSAQYPEELIGDTCVGIWHQINSYIVDHDYFNKSSEPVRILTTDSVQRGSSTEDDCSTKRILMYHTYRVPIGERNCLL